MNQGTCLKLLSLALDKCNESEADLAAVKLFRALRSDSVPWDRVWQKLHPGPGSTVVGFGNYRGWTITAIFEKDPGYVEWLARECRSPFIRKAAQSVMEAFK